MDYELLTDTLKHALPINRKERFYTGTVLPSLLFHGGLSNLYSFLRQIRGFPDEVKQENTKDAFLFYTEYNLKESAGKRNVGTEIFTATRDTPDVVIQILQPVTAFVIVEAKMFAKLTQNRFDRQMKAQKNAIIDVLTQTYQGCYAFHIALLPNKLGFQDTSDDYQILNWEFFLDNKGLNLQGNYFIDYLKYALKNYDKLVSKAGGKASTIQAQKSGMSIYLDYKEDKIYWVGRFGGIATIEDDVRTGAWRNKLYGINIEEPRDGREGNWVTSKEFADIIRRGIKSRDGT